METETGRLIDYNERYHYIPPNTKIVLSSTAESVAYNNSNANGLSEINLNFTIDVDGNFLDRAVVLKFPNIPLTFERTLAIGGAAGSRTLDQFFGGYDIIALRQFGMLNAISSIRVSLDGKLNHTCTDVGRCLGVVSQFYSADGIHRWFQASKGDVFPLYSMLSSTSTIFDVVSEDGTTLPMRKPTYGTSTVFDEISDEYSSRVPLFKTDTALDQTSTSCNATLLDQKVLLPFNILGIPSDETPLYGVKKITISVTLYGDWWKRIFSLRAHGTGPVNEIKDITFRRDKLTQFQPRLAYTIRTGPADSIEKAQRPFAVETAIVEHASNLQQFTVKARESTVVKSTKFDLSCIPKRSYIYVKALYTKADAANLVKEARMADAYGRIDSLTVKVGNKTTIIASDEASRIFDISKENGLNKSFNQAMYFMGCPAVIDYSEAVGLEPGTLVGTPGSRNGGAPPLWVDLKFTNLAGDEIVYEVGCVHVYQGMLVSADNSWSIKQSFETSYDSNSGLQDFEQQLMRRINYIGGRSGGGLGTLFSTYLPKIGNGIKNLVTAAFTDPNFRNSVKNAWDGTKKAGATFDDHQPMSGGFYAHSNSNNERGGKSIQNWVIH